MIIYHILIDTNLLKIIISNMLKNFHTYFSAVSLTVGPTYKGERMWGQHYSLNKIKAYRFTRN